MLLMKCHDFMEKCLKYIAALLLLLLTVLMALFENSITFDAHEISTVYPNGIKFLLLLTASAILLPLVCCLLKRVPEAVLFWVLAVLYLVAGCYLITHIQMQMRHDSGLCYWNALNYVRGLFTYLYPGDYFYMYPHQLGLVTYNCLLLMISDQPDFVYFVNLFWILITNFFLWRTTVLLYEHRTVLGKLVILFSFLFLPHFFYLFYAYGQVPGMGGLMIALYLIARALKKNSIGCMLVSLVFIAGACLVRKNYLIAGIAVIIIYLFKLLETKRKVFFIGILCTVCVMVLPANIINSYYEKVANTNLDNGMPALLHVAMGLQEGEDDWRADGWFNGFNENTYLSSGCDVELSQQIAMDSIGERMAIFIQNPCYVVEFFGGKIITTWCEPTFESVWSGPLISLGSETEIALLEDLYSGGISFRILSSLMNVLNVFVFAFAFFYVMWKILRDRESLNMIELFGILFFIGGFLFHLFWETSCQYVYPYVVLLIPVAARGIDIAHTNGWGMCRVKKYKKTK